MQSIISVWGPDQGEIVFWPNRCIHLIFWSIKNQSRQCMKTGEIKWNLQQYLREEKNTKKPSLLCWSSRDSPRKRQCPFCELPCAESVVVFKITSTLVNKTYQGTVCWPQGQLECHSFWPSFPFLSHPNKGAHPNCLLGIVPHYRWSVQVLFARELFAIGQVCAKDCTDSRAAGWCYASTWAYALALFGCLVQIAHMSLTLGCIHLFLQPFLEFLAWILVLFVCLRIALAGSELPSGVGQITQPITGCLMSRGRRAVLWHGGMCRAVCLAGWCVKSRRVSALPQHTSACTDHDADAFTGQFS